MTDGDALLAAIYADPADDTPRLVYADWLDENGEEDRGTFIRVQVESALFASLRDGDLSKSKTYAAYLRRENALLDAHRRDWLGGPKCGACGGKRTRTTRWRIAEMNADDYGESTSTCDACRGTGYECWPLVETGPVDDPDREKGAVYVPRITSHFARGFVSRIELRAEQYTAEVARLVFTHHPTITEVLLTDRAPLLSGSDATGGPDWAWVIRMGDDRPGDDRLRPDDGQQFIRRPIWEKLDGHIKTPSARTLARRYASRDDAHAALLRAATDWGRELAGLPPLTPR